MRHKKCVAAAQPQRSARVAEPRRNGKSGRQIAEEEGISEKQVRKDLKQTTADGYAVEPEAGQVLGQGQRLSRPHIPLRLRPNT
jgi:biotin operon repressor